MAFVESAFFSKSFWFLLKSRFSPSGAALPHPVRRFEEGLAVPAVAQLVLAPQSAEPLAPYSVPREDARRATRGRDDAEVSILKEIPEGDWGCLTQRLEDEGGEGAQRFQKR